MSFVGFAVDAAQVETSRPHSSRSSAGAWSSPPKPSRPRTTFVPRVFVALSFSYSPQAIFSVRIFNPLGMLLFYYDFSRVRTMQTDTIMREVSVMTEVPDIPPPRVVVSFFRYNPADTVREPHQISIYASYYEGPELKGIKFSPPGSIPISA